jgi:hypothetical protein
MNMAHHNHSPNQPHDEGKVFGDFKIHSTVATAPKPNGSSHEVEKQKKVALSNEHKKSFLDYEITGFAWPFVFVMSLIAIAVLGMILKLMGIF